MYFVSYYMGKPGNFACDNKKFKFDRNGCTSVEGYAVHPTPEVYYTVDLFFDKSSWGQSTMPATLEVNACLCDTSDFILVTHVRLDLGQWQWL